MKIAQKLGLVFGKTLIALSVGLFVLGFLFISTLSRPEKLKLIIAESGLYQAVADTIQEQFVKDNGDLQQIPNDIIQNALEQTFNEETAKDLFESSIDNTYGWLDGSREELTIELDTNELQQTFTGNIEAGLLERLEMLPTCPSGTLPPADLASIDCIPQGLDIGQITDTIKVQIDDLQENVGGEDVISISPETTNEQGETTSLSQELKPVKDIYRFLTLLPYITAGLFIIGLLLVVALSKPRYKALRTLSVATLPYGVLYVLSGVFLPRFFTSTSSSLTESISEPALKEPVSNILSSLSSSIGRDFIWVGVILIAIGAILLVAYLVMKKKNPPKHPKTDHQPTMHHPEPSKPEHTSS